MATALLVLDMLTDFTSDKLANPAAAQIIEPIAALTRAAREHDDWLVIYGNDAHRPGDFELAVFGEHAMAGSPGAAVTGATSRPRTTRWVTCILTTVPRSPTMLRLCSHAAPSRPRPGRRAAGIDLVGVRRRCALPASLASGHAGMSLSPAASASSARSCS